LADLPFSIRTGRPAFERLNGKTYFDYLAEHPEPARVFHDAMTSLSASSGNIKVEGRFVILFQSAAELT